MLKKRKDPRFSSYFYDSKDILMPLLGIPTLNLCVPNSNHVKKFAFLLPAIFFGQVSFGQTTPDTSSNTASDTSLNSDKNIRNKVLSDIQDNLDKKTKNIDQTLNKLDHKVDSLDLEIAASRDARDKADKLLLRVQALEKKQG